MANKEIKKRNEHRPRVEKTTNLQNRRATSPGETRICGRPSLTYAHHVRMYDDTDSEEELSSISTPQANSATIESPQIPEHKLNKNKLLTPSCSFKKSNYMWNIIPDVSLPTEFLSQDVPPPPVIPQGKRKKPEETYIEGCKERPQVANNPSTNSFKGDEDHGADASSAEPDSPPHKRAKKSKIPSYSESILNAKSDEITDKLAKNYDNIEETNNESSDRNKTIEYVPPKILSPKQSSFSPLPSTSRDSETFSTNELLFNRSLRENTLKDESTTPQTTPNATIVIDDDEDDIEFIPTPQTGTNPGLINGTSNNSFSSMQNSTETNNQNNLNNIPIVHHDTNINLTYDNNDGSEEVSEIPSPGHSSDVSMERPILPEQHTTRPSTSENLSVKEMELRVFSYFLHNPIALYMPSNPVSNTSSPAFRRWLVRRIKYISGLKDRYLELIQLKNDLASTPQSPNAQIKQKKIGICPICKEPMITPNPIASTVCGHLFCLKCIHDAFRLNGRRCPTCRKVFRGVLGYHKVYF